MGHKMLEPLKSELGHKDSRRDYPSYYIGKSHLIKYAFRIVVSIA